MPIEEVSARKTLIATGVVAAPEVSQHVEPVPGPSVTGAVLHTTDPVEACIELLTDERHAHFPRMLVLRPPARWYTVTELAAAGNIAVPAVITADAAICWLAHPTDNMLAVVIVLSPHAGWRTVITCARPRF